MIPAPWPTRTGLRSGTGPIILGGGHGVGDAREMVAGPRIGAVGRFVAMRFIQVTLLLVFLAAVAAFALQNNNVVDVRFLQWRLTAPMAALIAGVYLLGM